MTHVLHPRRSPSGASLNLSMPLRLMLLLNSWFRRLNSQYLSGLFSCIDTHETTLRFCLRPRSLYLSSTDHHRAKLSPPRPHATSVITNLAAFVVSLNTLAGVKPHRSHLHVVRTAIFYLGPLCHSKKHTLSQQHTCAAACRAAMAAGSFKCFSDPGVDLKW